MDEYEEVKVPTGRVVVMRDDLETVIELANAYKALLRRLSEADGEWHVIDRRQNNALRALKSRLDHSAWLESQT